MVRILGAAARMSLYDFLSVQSANRILDFSHNEVRQNQHKWTKTFYSLRIYICTFFGLQKKIGFKWFYKKHPCRKYVGKYIFFDIHKYIDLYIKWKITSKGVVHWLGDFRFEKLLRQNRVLKSVSQSVLKRKYVWNHQVSYVSASSDFFHYWTYVCLVL